MGILDSFRPTVTIVASPDEFTFIGKDGEHKVRTLIRLAENRKILAVGEEALDASEGGTLISLFQRPANAAAGWFDTDAFRRYYTYNVLVAAFGSLLSPVVRLTGARHFRSLFDGKEIQTLSAALRVAGTPRVEVES